MAAITIDQYLSALEISRRIAPDGTLMRITEVLDQVNDIMKIMPFVEANGIDLHKEVRRASEPEGDWVDYNDFAGRSSTKTGAVEFRLSMLKQFNTPDKDLIDNAPDPQGKRMQEARGTISGMTKTLVNTMIYGNSATNSKRFTGLAPNLANTSNPLVIDGGGTGSDVTSIYAVALGEDSVFMAYPKGNPSIGIMHEDMGQDTITNASSQDRVVYRDYFKFHGGLVIKDPRAIGRYANIEVSGTENVFDEDNIIDLHYQMQEYGDRVVYLANRGMLAQIHKTMKDKNNAHLGWVEVFGKTVVALLGRPILLVDQISNTETAI